MCVRQRHRIEVSGLLTEHCEQLVWPGAPIAVPFAQGRHEDFAGAAWYLPAGHAVQAAKPGTGAKLPLSHWSVRSGEYSERHA